MWLDLSVPAQAMQMAFYAVIGVVTVLTYRQAKKTFFQPIRAEVFKQQLAVFQQLLARLQGKSELELREDFALPELARINCFALLDSYAERCLQVKIDRGKRPYDEVKHRIVRNPEKYFVLADEPFIPSRENGPAHTESPPTCQAWQEYEFDVIGLPDTYVRMLKEFGSIVASPLLPGECVRLCQDFISTLESQVKVLAEVLSECSRELPGKYPTIDDLERASTSWIWIKYNRRLADLEGKARAITEWIRQYCSVDRLLA